MMTTQGLDFCPRDEVKCGCKLILFISYFILANSLKLFSKKKYLAEILTKNKNSLTDSLCQFVTQETKFLTYK